MALSYCFESARETHRLPSQHHFSLTRRRTRHSLQICNRTLARVAHFSHLFRLHSCHVSPSRFQIVAAQTTRRNACACGIRSGVRRPIAAAAPRSTNRPRAAARMEVRVRMRTDRARQCPCRTHPRQLRSSARTVERANSRIADSANGSGFDVGETGPILSLFSEFMHAKLGKRRLVIYNFAKCTLNNAKHVAQTRAVRGSSVCHRK
jgi:hypothetical protein